MTGMLECFENDGNDQDVEKEPGLQAAIVQFPLHNFSLQTLKLTLRDILLECTPNSKDALEEFFPDLNSLSTYSNHLSDQAVTINPHVPCTKINMDCSKLTGKQNALKALIQLYCSEIVKLSSGSRLWFGNINSQNVSLFIDFCDQLCQNYNYASYLEAIKLLFTEQLQICEKATVNVFGMTVTKLDGNIRKSKTTFEKMFSDIESQGSCNLLNCFKAAFEVSSDTNTILIILCSRPNQDLDVMYDYVVQVLSGRNQIKIHIAAINVDNDVQVFLKDIIKLCEGYYHCFHTKESETIIEDSLIEKLYEESKTAEKCISEIDNIKMGKLDQSLIDTLKELALVVDLRVNLLDINNASHFSCYSIPCSTEVWLKTYGLDSLGLNLYTILEPDAYTELSEYVSVIDKTTLSTVYNDVMPKFTWNDGTRKYLHVNVHKLENYEHDLREYSFILEKRLMWLQSESRVMFGNVPNDKVIFIIDNSLKTSLYLVELKQHLKTLLHEQIVHKKSFNFISYSKNGVVYWHEGLCFPSEETLADAWRWILNVKPTGSFNLLACLRNSFNQCKAAIEDALPIDIYLMLSSIPDQDASCVCGFIEQLLSGLNIRFHVVLYQPCMTSTDTEILLLKGLGRYAEETDINVYAETLSAAGTLHEFRYGEFHGSTDHSNLLNEISRTKQYFELAKEILEKYATWCRKNVPIIACQDSKQSDMKFSCPPVYPRPTFSSIARMNYNIMRKAQTMNETSASDNNSKENNCSLTCHTFYTGVGIRKGVFYDLVDFTGCTKNMPLIPNNETYSSSVEWLGKYSLKSLGLYTDNLFTVSKSGFQHVTTDGRVVQLKMNHQQLYNLMLQVKKIRMRYFSRMKWLLSDSRLVFGCIIEEKVILMIDISASMSIHLLKLTEQISDLINEQFTHQNRLLNVVVYAETTRVWRSEMCHCTENFKVELMQWMRSLTTGGSSCLLEGIEVSLSLQPDAIYIITDGGSDHSYDFVLSHVKKFCNNCMVHTISHHSRSSEGNRFLQELAYNTSGRYHCYPMNVTYPAIEPSHIELGNDLKLLAKEIELVDYIVNRLLYYMGRPEACT